MNPNRRYDPTDEPLWLIVQQEDRTHCFTFPSSGGKAIVIGSCGTADVRIRTAAPIVFFLEREGQSILLTPAYPEADLRLDACKVNGERRIHAKGLIEIGEIQLRLIVRDTPPTLRADGREPLIPHASDAVPDPVAGVIDYWAATTAIDTSAIRASLSLGSAGAPMTSERAMPAAELIAATLETVLPNFDEWFERALLAPSIKHLPRRAQSYTTTLEMAPVTWPPQRLERDRVPPGIREEPATRGPPAAISVCRRVPAVAVLERLGLLTLRRPWLVMTTAAAGALLLGFLAVGAERFLGHRRASKPHPENHSPTAVPDMRTAASATTAKQVPNRVHSRGCDDL